MQSCLKSIGFFSFWRCFIFWKYLRRLFCAVKLKNVVQVCCFYMKLSIVHMCWQCKSKIVCIVWYPSYLVICVDVEFVKKRVLSEWYIVHVLIWKVVSRYKISCYLLFLPWAKHDRFSSIFYYFRFLFCPEAVKVLKFGSKYCVAWLWKCLCMEYWGAKDEPWIR